MRCLLTGMSAAQVNPINHERSPNFPGLLAQALRMSYHLTWCEPSVLWDDEFLDDFELLVVGVSPITALGANRAYGALNVIERMWGDPRLRIMVDAPDPFKVDPSFKAILSHPENLTKAFFSGRKEYQIVESDPRIKAQLLSGIKNLNTDDWPVTIIPTLPWKTQAQFKAQLSHARRTLLLNLDQFLFHRFARIQSVKSRVWAAEPGAHPSWLRRSGVTWPVEALPKTHRRDVTYETLTQLTQAGGCLISPGKQGTWWSPRYAMSLSQRTPVFTDWHETQFLSNAWTHLPSAFEHMPPEVRAEVANEQFASYIAAIPFDLAPVGD